MSGVDQQKPLAEVIYTPESQLRHPSKLIQAMLRDLVISRELAWRLLVRNISAQYRQTVLGYLWAFLPPIFTTLSFSFLNSSGVIGIEDTSVPYPLYVLTGTVLWQAFADALYGPIRLAIGSREMLSRVNFPREALILTATAEVLVFTAIRLLMVGGAMIWFGASASLTLILAPLSVFGLVAFGIVIGVLLAPLALLIHDVERGLVMIMTLWFFLTPVVYPVPSTWPASLLVTLNPVGILLSGSRYLFVGGVEVNWWIWLAANAATFSLLFFAWGVYRLAMPHILSRISA